MYQNRPGEQSNDFEKNRTKDGFFYSLYVRSYESDHQTHEKIATSQARSILLNKQGIMTHNVEQTRTGNMKGSHIFILELTKGHIGMG